MPRSRGASRQRWGRALGLVLLAVWLGPRLPAEEPLRPTATPGAAEAVAATLEVERVLLKEDRERREALAEARKREDLRLSGLYDALDLSARRDDPEAADAVDEAWARIESSERRRQELLSSERLLLEKIRDRIRRITLLEEKVATLQVRRAGAVGPLTGDWDVTLLPSGNKGTFSLTQSGTLVSGAYTLEGGWNGSLQGTYVNRKVRLDRIDSKLGRATEFEGYLSPDGTRIRGNWTSYDLASEGGSTGQWSAVRR